MAQRKADSGSTTWRARTKAVRGGTLRSEFRETSEAIFLTSGYTYERAEQAEAGFQGEDVGFIYSRFDNPTVSMFEKRLSLLEGAEDCRATASGMAAVFASLMCQLRAGDHVVAARALFGSCQYIITELLPRYGMDVTLVDGTDSAQWKSALSRKTAAVFLETPSNPTLEIIDLSAVAELAHEAGARLIVDNVFATPILQQPLELGADLVVYSATKHLDGQGRCLGGAVLGKTDFVEELLEPFLRHTGPTLSAFNAWVLLKGLETLELRIGQHCQNTEMICDFLSQQKKVDRIFYPGLASDPGFELAKRQMKAGGSILAFEIKGGREGAFRFLNALQMVDISNNLGDTKSLITHPATTTHQRIGPEERARLGITDGLVRLSVGLEDVRDIREDLEQALGAV
jgi:O-succinylhomoserine sulfhydrylase